MENSSSCNCSSNSIYAAQRSLLVPDMHNIDMTEPAALRHATEFFLLLQLTKCTYIIFIKIQHKN